MAACKKCTKPVKADEVLKCTICKGKFHAECGSVSKTRKSKVPPAAWVCSMCIDSDTTDNSEKSNTDQITKSFITKQISDLKSSLLDEFTAFKSSIIESITFLSLQYEDLNKQVQVLQRECKEIEKVKQKNSDLQSRIEFLEGKFNEMEHKNLSTNVEVRGIPETEAENLKQTWKTLTSKLDLPNSAVLIERSRESQGPSLNPRPIIITLPDVTEKKKLLDAVSIFIKKTRKPNNIHPMNTVSMGLSLEPRTIFISEQLTKKTKFLLSRTKVICKERDYKYTWVKNGQIMARKDDGSRVVYINSERDIQVKIV